VGAIHRMAGASLVRSVPPGARMISRLVPQGGGGPPDSRTLRELLRSPTRAKHPGVRPSAGKATGKVGT